MNVFDVLSERGFIEQTTDDIEFRKILDSSPQGVYVGFDPTASSLHIGSLIPLMGLSHFQRAGHQVYTVVGGATGMIGDPSGKSEERNFLNEEIIRKNVEAQKKQIAKFIDFEGNRYNPPARMMDNLDWTKGISFIEWLRDVGKLFTVNYMVAKESVRRRFEDRNQGISYTEFSYMLLQAHDFYHLFKEHGCKLQVGGGDQWGNITAGIELIRRKTGQSAYGATFPLLTTSSGQKFGKTEAGAIWLDSNLTSVWDFYQYFIRTEDKDINRFLKLFTFLPMEEIESLSQENDVDPGKRTAHKKLAFEVTAIIHGQEQAIKMEQGALSLYSGKLEELDNDLIQQVFSEGPTADIKGDRLSDGVSIVDISVESGLVKSKGEARRNLKSGAIYVNNQRVTDEKIVNTSDILPSYTIIIRKGKKNYLVIKVV